MRKKKRSGLGPVLTALFLIMLCGLVIGIFWVSTSVKENLNSKYGPPSADLSRINRIKYSIDLYSKGDELFQKNKISDEKFYFEIAQGETIGQIAFRLAEAKVVGDADLFREYLIYKGYDRYVQIGVFRIEPGINAIEVAKKITNPTPELVQFNILPGWRVEEIAASLPRSGLAIDPQDFIHFVKNPPTDWFSNEENEVNSLEGYLSPGQYLLDRNLVLSDFIRILTDRFEEGISDQVKNKIKEKGLTLSEVVIIASIVERETIDEVEMPLIASVFLNRYYIGMKLDSDPTVQYAIGYNKQQVTWWTNPLSIEDLQISSPFNTYLNNGLPPGPICNPSLSAIQAVVFPEESNYYYFRARCDGSGLHNFAENYDEHLKNECQ
ncbi:MAG: endolytic transglycosylase MltG [Anaerolineaceae bacterium]